MTNCAFNIGTSKLDITFDKKVVAMLGWADTKNLSSKGVESKLYARTVVLESVTSKNKIVLVSLELCFIADSIHLAVINKLKNEHPNLKVDEQNFVLSANHTHSSPGGYCHYPIYNLPTPGYCPENFHFVVDKIVEAIILAHKNFKLGNIKYIEKEFPEDVPVAFNRIMMAYNANKDVPPVPYGKRNLAVDRTMYLMRVEDQNQNPLASINWFGVHCTSIKNDNKKISSDNKGHAASLHESWVQAETNNPDFISLFFQSTAGDVSPNYRRQFGMPGFQGPYRDNYANKNFNGELQAKHAHALFNEAKQLSPMDDRINSALSFYDFTNIQIDPEFCDGKTNQRTGYAAIGVSMIGGAYGEGGGLPSFILGIMRLACRFFKLNDDEIHGKKDIVINTLKRTFMGLKRLDIIPIPSFIDLYTLSVQKLSKVIQSHNYPIYHSYNPIQIMQIGDFAMINLPAEPTTTMGRRIKKRFLKNFQNEKINKIVVHGFCNAYSGYITTFEEYQIQTYEGGHTVYGKWTGSGYLTLLKKFIPEFLSFKNGKKPTYIPERVPDNILNKFLLSDIVKR